MAKYSIYYDATVQVDVEADSDKEAENKADEVVGSIGLMEPRAAELSVQQIYLRVNVDTQEEVYK